MSTTGRSGNQQGGSSAGAMGELERVAANRRRIRRRRMGAVALAAALVLMSVGAAFSLADSDERSRGPRAVTPKPSATRASTGPSRRPFARPPTATVNIYSHTRAGMLTPVARRARYLVYVPDSQGNGVYVINPRSYRVIDYFPTGAVVHTSCRHGI